MFTQPSSRRGIYCLALAVVTSLTGCLTSLRKPPAPIAGQPRELMKVTQPEYMVEPPDVLQIELLSAIPKQPYKLKPLDVLRVQVPGTVGLTNPIAGLYALEPDGTLKFGVDYDQPKKSLNLAGKTVLEAQTEIQKYLGTNVKDPTADVTLAQTGASQQVRGPHLVRPDGTVSLGSYGKVWVTGSTLSEAKAKIEERLSAYFQAPEVSLEVTGYNSKVYYIITDGGGAGQTVIRQPLTGLETVLDALSYVGGVQTVSDQRQIWIARPTDTGCQCVNLPVDWKAITECGDPRTNYQLLAGDRIFVQSYRVTRFETRLNRVLAPIERILGFTLLGVGALRTLQNQPLNGNTVNNNGVVVQ